MEPAVYAVATMDTKRDELLYVAESLRQTGVTVRTVDVSARADGNEGQESSPDVPRATVLGPQTIAANAARGEAVTAMGQALCRYLQEETAAGRVSGVIGLGGSGGTALITAADAALFSELEACLQTTPTRQLIRLPHHLNDPAFAAALVEHFQALRGPVALPDAST